MSAFLGPIHFWLFKKIKFQDTLTEKLFSAYEAVPEIAALRKKLDDEIGRLPQGELEDLIDTGNIHGWLQSQIHVVERRFAQLVTALKKGAASLEDVCHMAERLAGEQLTVGNGTSPEQAYRDIDSVLLNGMPCDHVNQVTESDEEHITWELAQDIHGQFWSEAGGDAGDYYKVREALFRGMLEGSGLGFEVVGQTYRIFKK